MSGSPLAQKRRRAERRGRRAEWLAALFLQLRGFSILARRFKCPAGEIDLIARRGKLIAFAEVKARPIVDDAILAVSPRARRRICAAAAAFIARRQALAECDIRYDILAVSGWRVHHIPDAWRDGEWA